MASVALWQQWRAVEVESAERSRAQATWVLIGAVDWARLILKEDARKGGADHLAEPWALALEQARLSTFLASDRSSSLAFTWSITPPSKSGHSSSKASRESMASLG